MSCRWNLATLPRIFFFAFAASSQPLLLRRKLQNEADLSLDPFFIFPNYEIFGKLHSLSFNFPI
jgi:hypothetical protein